MSVSRSPAPSSIDLSGVPARVAEAVAQVVAVCHEQFRSDPCPEAFEEAELRVRETMNALACELLGAVIEKRDDGASRIERDGQSWFRVAATPRTIMTSLGPLTYRRARYRSGASGSSPVPVDDEPGSRRLPDAAGGSARSGRWVTGGKRRVLCGSAACEHPALTRTMHDRETLGPETLDSIRDAEGVPHEAVSASVSLDGVMVPLSEDGPCRGLLARGRLRHGFLPRRQGRASEDPLSRSHARRAARSQSASRLAAAASGSCYRRRRRRRPSWRPWPETGLLACLRTSPNGDHALGSRGTARFCVTTPVASKVIA